MDSAEKLDSDRIDDLMDLKRLKEIIIILRDDMDSIEIRSVVEAHSEYEDLLSRFLK